jgi:hypothetical protein
VQAALGESLRGGPNTTPGVPATTEPTLYDADTMSTYLAEGMESPCAEDDPEAAEAAADPEAAAEAKEVAAAEAAEAAGASSSNGGEVGSHSGREFSHGKHANGHLYQPTPPTSPAVPSDGYKSDARSVDEILESSHESDWVVGGRGAGRKVVYHSRRSVQWTDRAQSHILRPRKVVRDFSDSPLSDPKGGASDMDDVRPPTRRRTHR